jgi:hypothetical protein
MHLVPLIPALPINDWTDVVLPDGVQESAIDQLDLAGLILRHGRVLVKDPVKAMMSGETHPIVDRIRSWLVNMTPEQHKEIVRRLDERVQELCDIMELHEEAPLRALLVRDEAESCKRLLGLLEQDCGLLKAVDDSANARNFHLSPGGPHPRLHAAWLEPGAMTGWWVRE